MSAAGNGSPVVDPLAVSAQFLRAPEVGPVLLRTDVRKSGGQATVVSVHLEQRGQSCVEGVVTTGRLPRERAVWADLPNQPAEPPGNALEVANLPMASMYRLTAGCDVRLDPNGAGFLHGQTNDPPRLRLGSDGRNLAPLQRIAGRGEPGPLPCRAQCGRPRFPLRQRLVLFRRPRPWRYIRVDRLWGVGANEVVR